MKKEDTLKLVLLILMVVLTLHMALRGNAWGAAIFGFAAGGYVTMMLRRD